MKTTAASSAPALAPISYRERHELIDVIRGFALFGVLLSNLTFNVFFATTRQTFASLPTASLEMPAVYLYRYFVQGKFMFLFALLFGLGLAVQMERAAARGAELGSVYLRRIGALFVLGVAHTVLLWFGDILHVYALAAVVLFLARRRGDRFLLICGGVLAYVPMTFRWCWPAVQSLLGQAGSMDAGARAERVAARVARLAEGHYGEVIADNLRTHAQFSPPSVAGMHLAYAVGVFMLGFVLGRRRYLQEAPCHLDKFRRMLRWGLAVGLVASFANATARGVGLSSPWHVPVRLPVMVGVVSLAAAYLAGLVLAYQRPSARRILAHLAPVGRMALTNYLTHSVFFVLIMSGVGLGLAGKFGPALTLPIALVIFAVQVVASHYWLRHFRFGPAEWLWRTLTYARRQPFRRFAGPESVETYVARRVPM